MEEERRVPDPGQNTVTPREYRVVISWAAGFLLLYAIGGYYGANLLRGYAAETAQTRAARLASVTREQNPQSPDSRVPSGAKPVNVLVGMSMNRIGEFAIKESAWTADFDLAFKWTGNSVDPGETFHLANGQIVQREKGRSFQRGDERFVGYHVVARMTKPFDASRFPFADEALLVQVEDAAHGRDALRYVADDRNIGVGPEAIPRFVKLARTLWGVRVREAGPVQTGSNVPGAEDGYSQFFFAMLIVPSGVGIYLKLFQALFASVALTVIALYIKPTHVDCRFGLPVGGFFASVGNNIFVGAMLPPADRLTLTDMINTVSLLTIFLVVAQSVISLHIYDTLGRERLSRFFDMVSVAVFALGYVGVNLVLPLAARP